LWLPSSFSSRLAKAGSATSQGNSSIRSR
jgi:hypothetical protein